jgi:hypothetical protein
MEIEIKTVYEIDYDGTAAKRLAIVKTSGGVTQWQILEGFWNVAEDLTLEQSFEECGFYSSEERALEAQKEEEEFTKQRIEENIFELALEHPETFAKVVKRLGGNTGQGDAGP